MKIFFTYTAIAMTTFNLMSCGPNAEQAKAQKAQEERKKAHDEMRKRDMEMDYKPYKNMSTEGLFKDK